jgi:hypothetical protein
MGDITMLCKALEPLKRIIRRGERGEVYHQKAAVTIDRLVTESRVYTAMFVNGSLVSLNVIFVAGNREPILRYRKRRASMSAQSDVTNQAKRRQVSFFFPIGVKFNHCLRNPLSKPSMSLKTKGPEWGLSGNGCLLDTSATITDSR